MSRLGELFALHGVISLCSSYRTVTGGGRTSYLFVACSWCLANGHTLSGLLGGRFTGSRFPFFLVDKLSS
jgi:hypothetical protein